MIKEISAKVIMLSSDTPLNAGDLIKCTIASTNYRTASPVGTLAICVFPDSNSDSIWEKQYLYICVENSVRIFDAVYDKATQTVNILTNTTIYNRDKSRFYKVVATNNPKFNFKVPKIPASFIQLFESWQGSLKDVDVLVDDHIDFPIIKNDEIQLNVTISKSTEGTTWLNTKFTRDDMEHAFIAGHEDVTVTNQDVSKNFNDWYSNYLKLKNHA
jgi:hypothetical protein